MEKTIKLIKKFINENLDKNRILHIESVKNTALKINKKYDLNVEKNKLILVSLAHDMLKIDLNEIKNIILKYNFKINTLLKKFPALWHGEAAALFLMNKYKIIDEEIIESVKYHSIGKKNASNLLKIIYIADYIEPERNFENLNLNKKSFENLLLSVIKHKIHYLLKNNKMIHPNSIDFYNDNCMF